MWCGGEGGRGKGGGGGVRGGEWREDFGIFILLYRRFAYHVHPRINSQIQSFFFKIIKVKKDWAKSGQTFKSMELILEGGGGGYVGEMDPARPTR